MASEDIEMSEKSTSEVSTGSDDAASSGDVDEVAPPSTVSGGASVGQRLGFSMSRAAPKTAVLPVLAKPAWFDMSKAQGIERARSARAPVHMDKLPAKIAGLQGQSFTVFDAQARPCAMRIAGFSVVAEAIVAGELEEIWNGERDEVRSDEAVAADLMEHAKDTGAYVALELDGTCEDAWLWGYVGDVSKDVSALVQSEDNTLLKQATAQIMALPGYRKILKQEGAPKSDMWHEPEQSTLQQVQWKGRTFALMHVQGGEVCSPFDEEFWALFALDAQGELSLLSDPLNPHKVASPNGFFSFTAITDFDQDGQPEFVGPALHMSPVDGVWRIDAERIVPYSASPC